MKNLVRSKKLRAALILALVIALMLPVMASAATAYINTRSSGLNLREGPGTGYSVVRSFPKGTRVEVLSSVNGWAYVYVGGYYGYMSESYLSNVAATGSVCYPYAYFDGTSWNYNWGYTNVNGEWYPLGSNGLPVGTTLNPWGPLSGLRYPWEHFPEEDTKPDTKPDAQPAPEE